MTQRLEANDASENWHAVDTKLSMSDRRVFSRDLQDVFFSTATKVNFKLTHGASAFNFEFSIIALRTGHQKAVRPVARQKSSCVKKIKIIDGIDINSDDVAHFAIELLTELIPTALRK